MKTSYFQSASQLICLALLICRNASATTLLDAIEIAKTNNKIIKAEDYKLEATKNLKQEAIAEFLPSVKASGQYGQRKSSAVISGGQNIGYNSNKVEEIIAEQPIFDGFGSVSKLNEANHKISAASAQNRSKKQEISFKVAQIYFDLFRYQELKSLQEDNQKLAEEIFHLSERRKAKGVIDKSDAIKFEYELAQAKTKLFEYEAKLTQSKFAYRDLVGEVHFGLKIPEIPSEKFDEKSAVEKAITNNENLKSYRFTHLATKSSYDIQKSEFSPTVSVVGSLSRQNNAIYFGGQDYQNRAVYLNVAVPIFQRGVEYSNLDKTRNQMSAAREEVEATKSQLIKDVGQALQEYELNSKMMSSNQHLVNLASERVEILHKKISAGIEDLMELLRAKMELNDKKISLINSQVDLLSTYYKIKFLIGEL